MKQFKTALLLCFSEVKKQFARKGCSHREEEIGHVVKAYRWSNIKHSHIYQTDGKESKLRRNQKGNMKLYFDIPLSFLDTKKRFLMATYNYFALLPIHWKKLP